MAAKEFVIFKTLQLPASKSRHPHVIICGDAGNVVSKKLLVLDQLSTFSILQFFAFETKSIGFVNCPGACPCSSFVVPNPPKLSKNLDVLKAVGKKTHIPQMFWVSILNFKGVWQKKISVYWLICGNKNLPSTSIWTPSGGAKGALFCFVGREKNLGHDDSKVHSLKLK